MSHASVNNQALDLESILDFLLRSYTISCRFSFRSFPDDFRLYGNFQFHLCHLCPAVLTGNSSHICFFSFEKTKITFFPFNFMKNTILVKNNIPTPICQAIYKFVLNLAFLGGLGGPHFSPRPIYRCDVYIFSQIIFLFKHVMYLVFLCIYVFVSSCFEF